MSEGYKQNISYTGAYVFLAFAGLLFAVAFCWCLKFCCVRSLGSEGIGLNKQNQQGAFYLDQESFDEY